MTRMRTSPSTRFTVAALIRGIGALFALIEAVYIVMVLLGANQENAFYLFIRTLAGPLALFFPGLFPVADPQLAILVNYGVAAVFWLVVTGIVARIFSP